MTPTILPLAMAVMLAAGMCGCDRVPLYRQAEKAFPRGVIQLVAEDEIRTFLVQDTNGYVWEFKADTFNASSKTNLLFSPINHAPVVVTNTVYVTNAVEK